MANVNCIDDIMIGLDAILLKPFEDNVKYAFVGWKSLALLHSWDEIVYKDIKRVFKYKEFKKEYQFIIKNEKQLIKQMKKRVRAYHSKTKISKKDIQNHLTQKKAMKKRNRQTIANKTVASSSKPILFHNNRQNCHDQKAQTPTPWPIAMNYEQQNQRYVAYNYNISHYQNGYSLPNIVEIVDNEYSQNSDENQSYISLDYMSYVSAINDNSSSSISLSPAVDNAFL